MARLVRKSTAGWRTGGGACRRVHTRPPVHLTASSSLDLGGSSDWASEWVGALQISSLTIWFYDVSKDWRPAILLRIVQTNKSQRKLCRWTWWHYEILMGIRSFYQKVKIWRNFALLDVTLNLLTFTPINDSFFIYVLFLKAFFIGHVSKRERGGGCMIWCHHTLRFIFFCDFRSRDGGGWWFIWRVHRLPGEKI